jgi:hypothetical protein
MKKTFYVNEYSTGYWQALIDLALQYGCSVEYDIYGNSCIVDSTEVENRLINGDESKRQYWAEIIYSNLHFDADKLAEAKAKSLINDY